jgi:hypothetical protein
MEYLFIRKHVILQKQSTDIKKIFYKYIKYVKLDYIKN